MKHSTKHNPNAKTVLVSLHTVYDKQGRPNLVGAKPKVYEVEHHYLDGRVRTVSGDVWEIRKNDKPQESTYIAVR